MLAHRLELPHHVIADLVISEKKDIEKGHLPHVHSSLELAFGLDMRTASLIVVRHGIDVGVVPIELPLSFSMAYIEAG